MHSCKTSIATITQATTMMTRLYYFAALVAALTVAISWAAELSDSSSVQFPKGTITGRGSGDEAGVEETTTRPTRGRKLATKTRGRKSAGNRLSKADRERARVLSGKGGRGVSACLHSRWWHRWVSFYLAYILPIPIVGLQFSLSNSPRTLYFCHDKTCSFVESATQIRIIISRN